MSGFKTIFNNTDGVVAHVIYGIYKDGVVYITTGVQNVERPCGFVKDQRAVKYSSSGGSEENIDSVGVSVEEESNISISLVLWIFSADVFFI